MYRKILLPLDGSELARLAIPHVGALARAFDASVVLLEVAPELRGPAAYNIEAAREDAHVDAQADLEVARELLQGYEIENVETAVLEGSPGETIVAFVEEARCDLIVMVTHGRSDISRALLGSVAEHVVRHSHDTPVL
ncbi:MAG: universal stress protein, partial [Dehalococcoidia bacterium]|nr:universal stress protein [Dehalococcoidia bacterium]